MLLCLGMFIYWSLRSFAQISLHDQLIIVWWVFGASVWFSLFFWPCVVSYPFSSFSFKCFFCDALPCCDLVAWRSRCAEAGVDAIPFWTFADGSTHSGVMSVADPGQHVSSESSDQTENRDTHTARKVPIRSYKESSFLNIFFKSDHRTIRKLMPKMYRDVPMILVRQPCDDRILRIWNREWTHPRAANEPWQRSKA